MELGSQTHKELFCRSIVESHREYDPLAIAWPPLEGEALQLLRSIPFWEEALDREVQAGRIVSAYAQTVSDPLVHEAIAVQGLEETRHAQLLEGMMRFYGLEVRHRPVAPLSANLEDAFMALGYEECLDSFFAFGMYKLAYEARLFPESLFAIFDRLIDEEARHNLYFVNWAAYHQIHKGEGAEPLRSARALWYYGYALARLVGGLASGRPNSPGFTAHGASSLAIDLTPESFIGACIAQQNVRMAVFDPRLLRPQLMPALAGFASEVLRLFNPKKSHPQSHSA